MMGEVEMENYCLKWNGHLINFNEALVTLQQEEAFFDVTLICGETQLKAHKLILSAVSPLFKDILVRSPHQHPMIYLRGIEDKVLAGIIEFMYKGEVSIQMSELSHFIKVAEDLKVKGLTQVSGESAGQPGSSSSGIPAHKTKKKTSSGGFKRMASPSKPSGSKVMREEISSEDPLAVEARHVKEEIVPLTEGDVEHQVEEFSMSEDYPEFEGGYEEIDYPDVSAMDGAQSLQSPSGQVNGAGRKPKLNTNEGSEIDLEEYYEFSPHGGYKCTICGHYSQSKRLIKIHLEGIHNLSTGYTCEYCQLFLKTHEALRIHKRRKHNDPQARKYY